MFINSKSIFSYLKTYKSGIYVIWRIFRNKYPLTVQLKNGQKYNIFGHTQAYFLTQGAEYLEYSAEEGILKLKYKKKLLLFSGALSNGEIFEIFRTESYGELKIDGAVVVDIGGNIGDSSIYFALNGARMVICIEPQEISFQAMVQNIKLNHLEDKITPLMAAVGSEEGIIQANNNDPNPTGGNGLRESKQGHNLQVLSLGSILRKFLSADHAGNKILKVDCEGCEYNLVLHSTTEELKQLDQIIIEYHYGVKNLTKKIYEAGFEVKTIKGMKGFNTKAKPHFMNTGILIGKKAQ